MSTIPSIKLAAVAIGLVCLVLFILSLEPGPSASQRSFASWCQGIETTWREGKPAPNGLQATLLGRRGDHVQRWKIESKSRTTTERVVRIIALAKDIKQVEPIEDSASTQTDFALPPGDYSLFVSDVNQSFTLRLDAATVANDIRLQNLVKLIELHGNSDEPDSTEREEK